jgi:hypothetical protein
MAYISIPYKIYKKIADYISTSDMSEHSNVIIRHEDYVIESVYEVKISKTHKDIPGFEAGIYATFSDDYSPTK